MKGYRDKKRCRDEAEKPFGQLERQLNNVFQSVYLG
jgi:hypothetical protein